MVIYYFFLRSKLYSGNENTEHVNKSSELESSSVFPDHKD